MINASSRNFRVVFEATDLTSYVSRIEISEQDNDQGLILQTGRIILLNRVNSIIEINNRKNPDLFQRGSRITIEAFNSANVLTRLKTMRILQASYDPIEVTQTVEIGCALKLIDYPVTRDCSVKSLDAALGSGKTKTGMINDFLGYFGLPEMVGTISGGVNYPVIGESQSLAQLAGQLAYDEGYSLWVDQQENIIPVSRKFTEVY